MPFPPTNSTTVLRAPAQFGSFFTEPSAKWNGPPTTSSNIFKVEMTSCPATQVTGAPRGAWRPPMGWYRNIQRITGSYLDGVGNLAKLPGNRVLGNRFVGYGYTEDGNKTLSLPTVPFRLEQGAIAKCYKKLKSQTETINISQNLVERKQTEKLLVDAVQRIRGTVKQFRSRYPFDWKNLQRTERGRPLGKYTRNGRRRYKESGPRGGSVPQGWLETQYGWNPLLMDCDAALKNLFDSENKSLDTHFIGVTRENASVHEEFPGNGSAVIPIKMVYDTPIEHLCKVRLDYVIASPALATAEDLGLLNVPSLAWEEEPLSFVVDWFFPVGDFLAQLTADAGYGWRGGSISRFTKTVGPSQCRYEELPGSHPPYVVYGYTPGHRYACAFERIILLSPPSAALPSPKKGFSFLHFSEGLSLLAQAFK